MFGKKARLREAQKRQEQKAPGRLLVTRSIHPKQRSRMMASVKKKNTKPEIVVRRFLHRRGLRFTLHDKRLPGRPDIVFPGRRAVVFVHGCFWHRCPHCEVGSKEVRSNLGYWHPKLERNQARDTKALRDLSAAGWRSFVVWECQVGDERTLLKLLDRIKRRPAASRVSAS